MQRGVLLYDQHGRELQANSWMHQGGRPSGRERRNVFAVAADSKQSLTSYTRQNTTALARYLIANVGMMSRLKAVAWSL